MLQWVAKVTVPAEELLRSAGLATLPLSLGLLVVAPVISFAVGLFAITMRMLASSRSRQPAIHSRQALS